MSWVEAIVRTRHPGWLRRRERAEGIASQAVIIGVTAVVVIAKAVPLVRPLRILRLDAAQCSWAVSGR